MSWLRAEAAKAIQEASGKDIGVFEGKIIEAAQVLILITIVVVTFLFYFMYFVQKAWPSHEFLIVWLARWRSPKSWRCPCPWSLLPCQWPCLWS